MAREVPLYFDVISGTRKGLAFDLARAALAFLSFFYGAAVVLRNLYFDLRKGAAISVGRPVVSIGNITTGGTGKTPLAAEIASRLSARGRKVAILTRGYKSGPAPQNAEHDHTAVDKFRVRADEAMLLKRRCPHTPIVIDPDRVAAAERAASLGADVFVLDDGFQHRRLARDLDIVLIDATRPFGHGHLLPRGLLREPASSLRRADLIVITRSNEIDAAARLRLHGVLRRICHHKPVIEADHRVTALVDIKGRPAAVPDLSAVSALAFAGIGNFESFRHGLDALGVKILAAYQYPDHHAYSRREIDGLADAALQLEANAVLTTEKDAVKLEGRWNDAAVRLLAPRLEITFVEDGDRILNEALDRLVGQARLGDSPVPTAGKDDAHV